MHLYAVFQGRYKDAATNLLGETWQTGVRFVATAEDPDPIGPLPGDTDVFPVPASHNRDETNWTIQGNWTLEMGINDIDPADWLNDQLAPAATTLFTNMLFSSSSFLERILVYPINSQGKVAPAPPYAQGTPVTLTFKSQTYADGGGGSGLCPPQISVVASTRTQQVGRSSRGRMFLAGLASSTITNFAQFGPTNAATLSGAVAAFLESVQLNAGDGQPKVLPAVVPGTWDRYALITEIQVGSVFDTQRRRRNQLQEVYSAAMVDNPA